MADNENAGLIERIGDKLIGSMPPAFLLLVLLNIAFLAFAVWTFSHNADQRNVLLTRIIDTCLKRE